MFRPIRIALLALLPVVCPPPVLAGETFAGRAVVVDARSVEVAGKTIRLNGIDAPDRGQICGEWNHSRMVDYPCGEVARAFLASLVADRESYCVGQGRDEAGVTLGFCFVDGRDIAREMVLAGWALSDTARSSRYASDQETAKTARHGLWAGAFEDPTVWRRRGPD